MSASAVALKIAIKAALSGKFKKIIKGVIIVQCAVPLLIIIMVAAVVSSPLEMLKIALSSLVMSDGDKARIYELRPDLNAKLIMPISKPIFKHNDIQSKECGIEFSSDGDDIYAVQDGVIQVDFSMGNSIEIKHTEKSNAGKETIFYSDYTRVDKIYVKIGDVITKGMIIGKAFPNPEKKENLFFSFYLRNFGDNRIDPMPYLPVNPNNTLNSSEVNSIEK